MTHVYACQHLSDSSVDLTIDAQLIAMGVYEKTNTFLNHQTVWLQPSAQMWPVP